MNAYDEKIAKDARLFVLQELAAQVNEQLYISLIQSILEVRYGVSRPIEWIETQLRMLEQLGAIELTSGKPMIAKLVRGGKDHLASRSIIAGITRPTELPV